MYVAFDCLYVAFVCLFETLGPIGHWPLHPIPANTGASNNAQITTSQIANFWAKSLEKDLVLLMWIVETVTRIELQGEGRIGRRFDPRIARAGGRAYILLRLLKLCSRAYLGNTSCEGTVESQPWTWLS